MKLTCTIRLEDEARSITYFQRFVRCDLYLCKLKTSSTNKSEELQEPRLVLRTADDIHKYKVVKNLRYIITKEIKQGKATIAMTTPQHLLLIQGADREQLQDFLKSLYKIAHKNERERLPLLQQKLPKPKPDSTNNKLSTLRRQFTSANTRCSPLLSKLICSPRVFGALSQNLRSLELTDSMNNKFPMALGLMSLETVSLVNCGLVNEDLAWFDELPIRKSLQQLKLCKNKLTIFPLALVDCLCLNMLNLSENEIVYIPASICRLQSLRSLNLSFNYLRYLPGSIVYLKLTDLNLTHNYFSNTPCNSIVRETTSLKAEFKLKDLAALKVDPSSRHHLTPEHCPSRLLQKLRCLSTCVCEKVTIPHPKMQYYVATNRINFSSCYWLHPQRHYADNSDFTFYLQYHFCEFPNRCENKNFRRFHAPRNCFELAS